MVVLQVLSREVIRHVTQGEEKSGSSVQRCFWLISRHQQSIPLISLSCATEHTLIPVTTRTYIVLFYLRMYKAVIEAVLAVNLNMQFNKGKYFLLEVAASCF